MNGAEFVMAVRARKPGLPILTVTGDAEPQGIAPGLPRLTNPFRSADLTQIIAALLREDAG
jgi:CheY-like chemotaxis protein